MIAKFYMKLDWKEGINIDLEAMRTWFIANCGSDYSGNSSDPSGLTLRFLEEPSEEIKEAIQAKWDGIDVDSSEVESYKSKEQIAADLAADTEAKKASAYAKLIALGLTADEIAAIGNR